MSDEAKQAADAWSYLSTLIPPAWLTVITAAGAIWAKLDKSGTLGSLLAGPKRIEARLEEDVTERRKLSEDLAAQNDALREELNRKHAAIVVRLDKQDESLADNAKVKGRILAELTPNGGSSLKDIVVSTHQMAVVTNARTRLIQANAGIAIFECDGDTGACCWVNEACCKIFDLSSEQMAGWGWLAAVEPKERETVKREWLASVKGDYPFAWTFTIVRKNGERTAVTSRAEKLADGTGKVLLFQGTVKVKH